MDQSVTEVHETLPGRKLEDVAASTRFRRFVACRPPSEFAFARRLLCDSERDPQVENSSRNQAKID